METEPLTTQARIEAARAELETAQTVALAALLHMRDVSFGEQYGVFAASSPILSASREEYRHATAVLASKRQWLRCLEGQFVREKADAEYQRAEADLERRKAWVGANRPELAAELASAQVALQAFQDDPYAKDSPRAQDPWKQALRRVESARQAITQAVQAAPAA